MYVPTWFPPGFDMFRFVIAVTAAACVLASPLAPTKLRIQEFPPESVPLPVVDAMVVTKEGLKFTWVNAHNDNNQAQTSCRILLGTSPRLDDALVWDSGVLQQSLSVVRKTGLTLKSSTTYFWAVQWVDSNGVFPRCFCGVVPVNPSWPLVSPLVSVFVWLRSCQAYRRRGRRQPRFTQGHPTTFGREPLGSVPISACYDANLRTNRRLAVSWHPWPASGTSKCVPKPQNQILMLCRCS
jgi:hypothetical protein